MGVGAQAGQALYSICGGNRGLGTWLCPAGQPKSRAWSPACFLPCGVGEGDPQGQALVHRLGGGWAAPLGGWFHILISGTREKPNETDEGDGWGEAIWPRAPPPPRPTTLTNGRGRGDPHLPPTSAAGQGGAGLELIMVTLHRGIQAGALGRQPGMLWLHEGTAAAGLGGAGHPVSTSHTAGAPRVGQVQGLRWALQAVPTPTSPACGHSLWWSDWGPASSLCPAHTSWR